MQSQSQSESKIKSGEGNILKKLNCKEQAVENVETERMTFIRPYFYTFF